jgi:hypothetical protein
MSTENKLNRDEVLANESITEIGAILEADVVAYTEEVSKLTLEELDTAEQELMEVFKVDDAHLAEVAYELPDSVEYDGHTVKRSDLASKIIQFINRIEVDFRATLGIYQGVRFWKTAESKPIPYGVFDSTLRLLGGLKFKGERDCFDILVINNWFATAHAAYTRDQIWSQYLHAKHNAILQARDALKKPATPEAEVAEDSEA